MKSRFTFCSMMLVTSFVTTGFLPSFGFRRAPPPGSSGSGCAAGINDVAFQHAADSLSLPDGTAVPTWADDSGQGNDATQANPSYQPQFYANVANSKPGLLFTGRAFSGPNVYASVHQVSVFAVVKPSAAALSSYSIIWAIWSNGSDKWHFGLQSGKEDLHSQNDAPGGYHNAAGTTSFTADVTKVVGFTSDLVAGSHEMFIGNVSEGAGTFSAGTRSGLAYGIGNKTPGGGFNFSGYILEIVGFKRALTSTERSNLVSCLNTKYGLP